MRESLARDAAVEIGIPAWAVEVLAETSGGPLAIVDGKLVAPSAGPVPVEDRIVDLSGWSQDALRRHAERFATAAPEDVEFLGPSQKTFRRLLREFAAGVAPQAVVGDFASGEAEFAAYFPTRRFVALDLSRARLRRAIDLGRVEFGVLADIRVPPLRPGSLDALTSSNTLNHLPDAEVPGIVQNLVRYLKPGGRLAATISPESLNPIIERLGRDQIERQVVIGGPMSRFWTARIQPRLGGMKSRVSPRARRAVRPLAGLAAGAMARCDRLVDSPGPAAKYWIVVRARSDH